MNKNIIAVAICVWSLGVYFLSSAVAATYYVDYEEGSDDNPGTTASAPFQHSPGDERAASAAAAVRLEPGDRVIFKGGVVYRGSIQTVADGAKHEPITYDGNTAGLFGEGRAVLDGSALVSGWEECGSINGLLTFCASLPRVYDNGIVAYQNGQRANLAQYPTPTDFYASDDRYEYLQLGEEFVDSTSIRIPREGDAAHALNALRNNWEDVKLLLWGNPNKVYERDIESFSDGRITFAPTRLYEDRPLRFAVVNHENALRAPGQFILSSEGRRIRFAPFEHDFAEYPASVGDRPVGINIRHNYTEVRGFVFERYFGARHEYRSGAGIRVSGDTRSPDSRIVGVVIDDNEVRYNYSCQGQGAITAVGSQGVIITNNRVHNNAPNRGIYVAASVQPTTAFNVLHRVGGTGIAHFSAVDGIIYGNRVDNILGVHSNGISLYLGSDRSVVCNNVVITPTIALTTKHTVDLLIAFNEFVATRNVYTVADWGEGGYLSFYNNAIVNDYRKALYVNPDSLAGLRVVNNIIDGALSRGDAARYSHNVYTSLAWNQNDAYGGAPNDDELEMMRSAVYREVDGIHRYHPTRLAMRVLQNGEVIEEGPCRGAQIDYVGPQVPSGADNMSDE